MPPRVFAQVATAIATATAVPSGGTSPAFIDLLLRSVVLGPIIGAVITLGGVLLSQRYQWRQLERTLLHQSQQEALKDARNLRDRRYERESVAYEEFLAAAWTMLTAAKAHHAMREIADVDVRRTRLEQDLAETVPKAQRALLRLTLDEDSADIRSLYEQARGAYRGHQALELLIKGLPPAQTTVELIRRQAADLAELEHLVEVLEQSVRRRLEQLRQPIPLRSGELPPDG